MTLRVKQVEADAKLLQEEVDAKLSEEEKCKTLLMATREKSEMLTQQLEDVQQSLSDMQLRYTKKCTELDEVQKHLKEKTKQLMYEEHHSKLELDELENTLRARVESIAQLKNGLMLNDVKIKDLSEMLQNASESAEQNKQSLTRRVSDIVNSNKLLEEEIKQERRRGEDLENDLIASERRLEESLAKLAAQERTWCSSAKCENLNAPVYHDNTNLYHSHHLYHSFISQENPLKNNAQMHTQILRKLDSRFALEHRYR